MITTKKITSDISDSNYYDKISKLLKIQFNKNYLIIIKRY